MPVSQDIAWSKLCVNFHFVCLCIQKVILFIKKINSGILGLSKDKQYLLGWREQQSVTELFIKAWCRESESNQRHEALQASALPLSYPGAISDMKN
jgi:hypothetical protein